MNNRRYDELVDWYHSQYSDDDSIAMISGDASFRKFYRCRNGILMDAPPETEKNNEFIKISNLLQKAEILAPVVIRAELTKGFLLVTDLGNSTIESIRVDSNQDELYCKSIDELIKFARIDSSYLPVYDEEFITRENNICLEWYFNKSKNKYLNQNEQDIFNIATHLMVSNNLAQPQIAMHRDYHSRNIMLTENQVAVVDFQDMVRGPLCYDLVSLLKDCYFELPLATVEKYTTRAYVMYKNSGLLENVSFEQFTKYVDITGLQRHVKCLGIFNRLCLRDGKSGYLKYIPLVLKYIQNVCCKYPELSEFGKLIIGENNKNL